MRQDVRVKPWTINVLCFGYHILCNHFSPLTQTFEFPSYDLGSLKAHILQGEVDKILKDSGDYPGQEACILLLPVCNEDIRQVEVCRSSVVTQQLQDTSQVQNGDNSWLHQERRHYVFMDLKGTYFQIPVHLESRPCLPLVLN